jgi:transcriptional regulator with XRE-family HTH domain
MKYRTALGHTIRELRIERLLTLREVARVANISLGYLSEVERGQKEISSEYLDGIGDALGVSSAHLVIEAGYRMDEETRVPENAEALMFDHYSDLTFVTELLSTKA